MNIKNLYAVFGLKKGEKRFLVEAWRKNGNTGHNDLLITLFEQKLWADSHEVTLYKDRGSVFCWKDHENGIFVELNENNEVCPECGWWKCDYCGSCYCNKTEQK